MHTVLVSAFYIDKHEVTKTLWDEVSDWATSRGYDIKPGDGDGKDANEPVYNITWYEAVKWANARSEKEGLTPAYYTSAEKSAATVYRNGQVNVHNDWVRWDMGYRLPTEAEWEKAARGGTSGHRFPWNDTETIQHARANYYSCPDGGRLCNSNSGYSYDTSSTRGLHPWPGGHPPYTTPVGFFAPNGYRLYDIAGNVYEWVWDWYSPDYYSVSPESDPRGPASGPHHLWRGGSWISHAYHCRVANRSLYSPGAIYGPVYDYVGFRLVRTAP